VTPEQFEISTEAREADGRRVCVVKVGGEIDLSNADQLATALRSAGSEDGAAVILDLERVSFMDSSGLAALLTANRELEGQLAVIVADQSALKRLFSIAGVEPHLQIVISEEEALAALIRSEANASG
jgi:anti-anti-sigma factor